MSSNYFPWLYDQMYSSSLDGDIEWYCDLARAEGGPVLELGVGTGRTLLPIAEEGLTVVGLDLDEGMLELLRKKVEKLDLRDAIGVVHGDMRSFDLKQDFAMVQIPFRGFLHNLTRDDQLACLNCVREHLRPGGLLAFNIFHPSLTYMSANTGALESVWRCIGTYEHPDGGKLVVSETNRYETPAQRVHSMHRVEHYVGGVLDETLLQSLELAYLYPGDVRELLRTSGFEEIAIAGGFDGESFDSDGQELVVKARVP